MGELKVQMLGGFALRMNGQELLDTDTRSKKAWILLAYLICQRENTVSQKKLIDLLWGEEPNSVNPENALRITMHRTRALLEQFSPEIGRSMIQRRRGGYQWGVPVEEVDVEVFERLCRQKAENPQQRLSNLLEALAIYKGDFLPRQSAEVWVIPISTYLHNLYLSSAREAVDLLSEQGRSFVPVSISLDRGATVITGANMGGKSVAMKTVALNVLLMQAGFLVCAKEAKMPLFESVLMLFEDMQSIQSGLSGFGSEIVQFQKALAQVEQGYSLFLLDEFARGTNPDEGAVIVQAVTKYLNGVNAISLLTTHYDKVADCGKAHYQIIGLRDIDPEAIRRELAVSGEDGIRVIARHMNYGLYRVEGRSDCPRDALNICRMLSLKPEILHLIEENY